METGEDRMMFANVPRGQFCENTNRKERRGRPLAVEQQLVPAGCECP